MTRFSLLAATAVFAATVHLSADDVKIYASKEFTRFTHPTTGYSIEYPSDWMAHPAQARTNIGSKDGLVPGTNGGFRTVYGVIMAVVDDPLKGPAEKSLEASSRAVVDTILKRNPQLSIKVPLAADAPLAGAPAFRAVATGTSPVTGHTERAEIICRTYDSTRLLYVIFVCPDGRCDELTATYERMRKSLQVTPVAQAQ